MKKLGVLILISAVLLSAFTGCGERESTQETLAESEADETSTDMTEQVLLTTETDESIETEVPLGTESEGSTEVASETKEYTAEEYAAAGINELNSVPILMYHRIYDMKNDETSYTGGNVDKDGYNRTCEAFEKDLEMYYEMGYRCIRLSDYLDGEINVPFGCSPLILTFDDGRRQAEIEGFDEEGNPIFLPHSALGIMEAFKEKHPDFALTATFFLMDFLFEDIPSYEDRIKVVQWLVENGYDVGNHTLEHPELPDCSAEEIVRQVGGMYQILEEVIPGKYVNIVALPYGMPTEVTSDAKYEGILHGNYEGFSYETKGTLLCGYTRECSPFTTEWDPTHIYRIRAYDNNGEEFDIQMCFDQLNAGKRYISDGDPDTVVFPADAEEGWLGDTGDRRVVRY